MRRLIDGSFDAANPDLSMLAEQNEKPAGIYLWARHAPGIARRRNSARAREDSTPLYRDVDVYARAVTPEGSILEATGFDRARHSRDNRSASAHVSSRAIATQSERPTL